MNSPYTMALNAPNMHEKYGMFSYKLKIYFTIYVDRLCTKLLKYNFQNTENQFCRSF